jgi:N-acetylornithine carbamoyltransferase
MSVHFLTPMDLTDAELELVMKRARRMKADRTPLAAKTLRVGALYFNPSLRTRVSFEQAARQIGASCQTLNAGQDLWALEMDPEAVMDGDKAECVVEAAGVLGRYFPVLGVRSFPRGGSWEEERREPVLRAFADHSKAAVISLEGAMHHPCQSLADHMTILEHFGPKLHGLKVVMSWAWHPKALPMAVPNSFALQMARAGVDLTIAHPRGLELDSELMGSVKEQSMRNGGKVEVVHDRLGAMDGAQVVYVKSWGSIGQNEVHPEELKDWCFNDMAWGRTAEAKVMHCLPVRRNVVIASSVLDSPRSIVLDQAENRMWAQAGLIEAVARRAGVLA